MPQKKYAEGGPARPSDFTDRQVEALAAGEQVRRGRETAEHARPRDLTEEDVEALTKGEVLDLEEVAPLPSVEGQERPHHITDADVEALVAGKQIRLEERPRLKAQRQA
jgi:hypothetical protein